MTDRIALVTGASRGLGYACGIALAKRGWHVVAVARTTGGLDDLADAIEQADGTSTLVPLDITDDAGLARMARAIHDRWGGLDALVHCAIQAAPCAPAQSVGEKDLDRCIATNLRATQRLITMCDPLLQARDIATAILPTDDLAGRNFFATYGATKAAQIALFESWASERKNTGPTVILHPTAPMPTATRARFYPGENRDDLTPCADEAERLIALLS